VLFEVKGAGVLNKGAELMLRAVLARVGAAFPDASFVVVPPARDDYPRRARLGLYQKVWFRKCGVQWGRFGWIVPQKLRQYYGLVLDDEIDVVLDASGFTYSDQCGSQSSLAMASDVKRWKKRGTKIILLPQAMGPFTSSRIRKAFACIVDHADLVFPRDEVSRGHVIDLVGERDNICQAPDFTNLLAGTVPEEPERFRGRTAFVPNCRMEQAISTQETSLYRDFSVRCIKCLMEAGHRPFVLIHEGERDMRLAKEIMCKLGDELDLVRETDALKAKGIIALCSAVVGSRYHALVSALCQGVPALAAGWSHKYEALFGEYGIAESCLRIAATTEILRERIEQITRDDLRSAFLSRITQASTLYKRQTEMMWDNVLRVIGK
jgi:polysaccharide pyruvyl transferase WcaK-like protein